MSIATIPVDSKPLEEDQQGTTYAWRGAHLTAEVAVDGVRLDDNLYAVIEDRDLVIKQVTETLVQRPGNRQDLEYDIEEVGRVRLTAFPIGTAHLVSHAGFGEWWVGGAYRDQNDDARAFVVRYRPPTRPNQPPDILGTVANFNQPMWTTALLSFTCGFSADGRLLHVAAVYASEGAPLHDPGLVWYIGSFNHHVHPSAPTLISTWRGVPWNNRGPAPGAEVVAVCETSSDCLAVVFDDARGRTHVHWQNIRNDIPKPAGIAPVELEAHAGRQVAVGSPEQETEDSPIIHPHYLPVGYHDDPGDGKEKTTTVRLVRLGRFEVTELPVTVAEVRGKSNYTPAGIRAVEVPSSLMFDPWGLFWAIFGMGLLMPMVAPSNSLIVSVSAPDQDSQLLEPNAFPSYLVKVDLPSDPEAEPVVAGPKFRINTYGDVSRLMPVSSSLLFVTTTYLQGATGSTQGPVGPGVEEE